MRSKFRYVLGVVVESRSGPRFVVGLGASYKIHLARIELATFSVLG